MEDEKKKEVGRKVGLGVVAAGVIVIVVCGGSVEDAQGIATLAGAAVTAVGLLIREILGK